MDVLWEGLWNADLVDFRQGNRRQSTLRHWFLVVAAAGLVVVQEAQLDQDGLLVGDPGVPLQGFHQADGDVEFGSRDQDTVAVEQEGIFHGLVAQLYQGIMYGVGQFFGSGRSVWQALDYAQFTGSFGNVWHILADGCPEHGFFSVGVVDAADTWMGLVCPLVHVDFPGQDADPVNLLQRIKINYQDLGRRQFSVECFRHEARSDQDVGVACLVKNLD